MSEMFFESPTYVYIALGLAFLAIAAVWHETRSKRLAKAMLLPVGLAVIVAAVEAAVVTDREKILQAAEAISRAAEAHQGDRIVAHVDDDFQVTAVGTPVRLPQSKSFVAAAAETILKQYRVTDVKLSRCEVKVSPPRALMAAQTMIHYDGGRRRIPVTWEVVWIKRGEQWKVLEVAEMRQGLRL